jgi:hypothetical protein
MNGVIIMMMNVFLMRRVTTRKSVSFTQQPRDVYSRVS